MARNSRNRNSRAFKLFTLANTLTDADGNISCILCGGERIGHGVNVVDRFDAFFAHRQQHEAALNSFTEKPKARECVVDHSAIVAAHRGKHALQCGRCNTLIWKPILYVEQTEIEETEQQQSEQQQS